MLSSRLRDRLSALRPGLPSRISALGRIIKTPPLLVRTSQLVQLVVPANPTGFWQFTVTPQVEMDKAPWSDKRLERTLTSANTEEHQRGYNHAGPFIDAHVSRWCLWSFKTDSPTIVRVSNMFKLLALAACACFFVLSRSYTRPLAFPTVRHRANVTEIPSDELKSFAPFTQFARAAYCRGVQDWKCGGRPVLCYRESWDRALMRGYHQRRATPSRVFNQL